jgi:hypothetical protein
MREEIDRVLGFSTEFPGNEALSITPNAPDLETGLVTLWGSVPVRGLPALVRLNLFSELSAVRDHVASCILAPSQSGSLITASGILADSWHVYAQCTDPRQDVRLALAVQPCCAPHRVRVRQDLLSLGVTGEGASVVLPAAMRDPPLVPWGEGYGLHETDYQTGTGGPLELPQGSRLWHWTATGIDATSLVTWETPTGTFQAIPVPPGPGPVDFFPDGQLSVRRVSWVNVTNLWYEVVR